MALINSFMVKNGASVSSLTLEADTGKSLLVKDIRILSIADTFLSVKIDKTLVGYFSIDNEKLGNLLGYELISGVPYRPSILQEMMSRGIFKGYPIAEGQKMVLETIPASTFYAVIIYEEYESGDITETMQNGTEASEYFILNYGDCGVSINTAGDHIIDNQVSPKDFPEFPYGKVVPAKKEIAIHALLASERGADDGTATGNYIITQYYKFKQERETLFDQDVAGIYALGHNVGAIGSFECENNMSILAESSDRYRRAINVFPSPLIFTEGEELNIYITTAVAATPGTFEQEETRICLPMTVQKVS